MEGKAIAKSVRISPIKARLVIDLIRGKKVDEAVKILENRDKKSSGIILKVLNSAIFSLKKSLTEVLSFKNLFNVLFNFFLANSKLLTGE